MTSIPLINISNQKSEAQQNEREGKEINRAKCVLLALHICLQDGGNNEIEVMCCFLSTNIVCVFCPQKCHQLMLVSCSYFYKYLGHYLSFQKLIAQVHFSNKLEITHLEKILIYLRKTFHPGMLMCTSIYGFTVFNSVLQQQFNSFSADVHIVFLIKI